MRKVILLELNEVPVRVIDRYVAERPASNMARLLQQSRLYVTHTEDSLQLDPWISWPTLHRGVEDVKHGILHLGQPLDEQNVEFPPIWEALKKSGVSVGVFGSMHSSARPRDAKDYAFYLPDYFAGGSFAHPQSLEAFNEFNLAMTRASARNVSTGIPWKQALRFLASAPAIGVTPGTATAIAEQLVRERSDPRLRIRRRNLQPTLMIDLFLKQLDRTQPQFSTFYTNHVAAAMHRYWAALFPEDYEKMTLTPEWRKQYSGEIIAAMDTFDEMLGKVRRFVDTQGEYAMVVASSLGQAAIPAEQTYSFLTITDIKKLISAVGLPDDAWRLNPTMVPCLSVLVEEAHLDHLTTALAHLRIGDARMVRSAKIVGPMSYDVRPGNHVHIFVQFDNYQGPDQAFIGNNSYTLGELGLGQFAHEDGVNCTAQHVPSGSLIVYRPGNAAGQGQARGEISTLDFAPSVLAHFGLSRPAYMRGQPSIEVG
jgi:hypothetical protein